jgi:hypothetical protein
MRSPAVVGILSLCLFILGASGAQATSYQDTLGTDPARPLQYYPPSSADFGLDHTYAGPNLQPGANLPKANLAAAY